MVCYKDEAQSFTGAYSSKRWFYVQLQTNGWYGYVHSSFVQHQHPGTASCDTYPELVAAQWAVTTYGKASIDPADNIWPASQWLPGPVGEWSGDCPKLTYRAWKYAGRPHLTGNTAMDIYRAYNSKGMIKRGPPPRGALVFWTRPAAGTEGTWRSHWATATPSERLALNEGKAERLLPDGHQRLPRLDYAVAIRRPPLSAGVILALRLPRLDVPHTRRGDPLSPWPGCGGVRGALGARLLGGWSSRGCSENPRRTRAGVRRPGRAGFSQGRRRGPGPAGRASRGWVWGGDDQPLDSTLRHPFTLATELKKG